MTREEFFHLDLLSKAISSNLLCKTKSGTYRPIKKDLFHNFLLENIEVKSPFRSIEELSYCVLHSDWPLDHLCIVCKKPLNFFGMKYAEKFCSPKCANLYIAKEIVDPCFVESIEKHFTPEMTFDEYRDFCSKYLFKDGISPKTSQNKLIMNYFSQKVKIASQWPSLEEFTWCVINDDERPVGYCECGKPVEFVPQKGRNLGYRKKTCGSKRCQEKYAHSREAYEKKHSTCIERYGTNHHSQTQAWKEKVKKTCLERYGVENYNRTEECKEKAKQTCLARYGVENPSQSEEVKEKHKQTMYAHLQEDPLYFEKVKRKREDTFKRNCEKNPHLKEEIRLKHQLTYAQKLEENPSYWKEREEKTKNTRIKKYGSLDAAYRISQEKAKETCLERYGVEHYGQTQESKEKHKQTCLEKYGVEYYNQTQERKNLLSKNWGEEKEEFLLKNPQICPLEKVVDIFSSLFSKYGISPYREALLTKEILKRMNIQEEEFFFGNKSNSHKFSGIIVSSIEDFTEKSIPLMESLLKDQHSLLFRSQGEKELCDFVCSLVGENNVKSNFHLSIDGKFLELDIFIPSKNIAIEYNGCYWHSFSRRGKYYHLEKAMACERRNIRLLQIWDYEWIYSQEKTKQFLANTLSSEYTLVGARQCNLMKISANEEKKFLSSYHLQGYKKSLVCYGLYWNNQLIQIMSFCKCRYRNYIEYELLRLCTRHGFRVLGGSERLFSHFTKEYSPKSIISYCDRNKFSGEIYPKLGFSPEKITPNLFYVKMTKKGYNIFSANSLARVGADKLIGTSFGTGFSNEEIVLQNGFHKIYGVGQQSFLWHSC